MDFRDLSRIGIILVSTMRGGFQTNFQEMQQHIRSNNLESLSLCNATLCALNRFLLVTKRQNMYIKFLKKN